MSKSDGKYFNSRPHDTSKVDKALLSKQVHGFKIESIPSPCSDMVLLEQMDDIQSSSIIIPGTARSGSKKFICVSKGPGRTTEFGATMIPNQCEVGDEVFANLNEQTCFPMFLGERQFYLVAAMNIVAVFPKAAESTAE